MLMSATFWFLVSFVLFFLFFGKAVWKMMAAGIDDRSRRIESDIQEAMELKEQAQELLNEIRSKQLEADIHAEAILEHARLEAERLRTDAAKEMDEYLRHREQLVQQRIEFAEQEALKDIQNSAVRMAVQAAEKIIEKVITKDVDAAITDKAIHELSVSSKR